MNIIHEEVIYSNDGYKRHIRRWIKGRVEIPGAKHIMSHTGEETVLDIKLPRIFQVVDDSSQPEQSF